LLDIMLPHAVHEFHDIQLRSVAERTCQGQVGVGR
jgi:hypothetical protein